jgi:hypothetical protein
MCVLVSLNNKKYASFYTSWFEICSAVQQLTRQFHLLFRHSSLNACNKQPTLIFCLRRNNRSSIAVKGCSILPSSAIEVLPSNLVTQRWSPRRRKVTTDGQSVSQTVSMPVLLAVFMCAFNATVCLSVSSCPLWRQCGSVSCRKSPSFCLSVSTYVQVSCQLYAHCQHLELMHSVHVYSTSRLIFISFCHNGRPVMWPVLGPTAKYKEGPYNSLNTDRFLHGTQWVPGLFPGGKAAGAWSWPPNLI